MATVGLIHCIDLEILELSGNNIGCKGAASLANSIKLYQKLRVLNLSLNRIGHVGGMALANFGLKYSAHVEKLDLSCNNIGDKGAFSLAYSVKLYQKLRVLNLSLNGIGDVGARALANVGLKTSAHLEILNLSCNNIGDKGALSLANSIKLRDKSLHKLDLGLNRICNAGAKAVVNATKCQVYLCNDSITNTDDIFRDNVYFHTLTFRRCNFKDSSILCLLRFLEEYAVDHGVSHVSAFDISSINISCHGAKSLSGCLKYFTHLKELNISFNDIVSEGAIAITESFKYFGCHLDKLDMSNNNMGSEGIKALADALQYCTNLRALDISNTNAQDSAGMVALGDALKHCHLRGLVLSYNIIGSDGACSIASSFSQCLCKLHIKSCGIGVEGCKAIAKALHHCINLSEFDISYNYMSQSCTVEIAEALKHCTELCKLDISYNDVGREGCYAIAKVLQYCINLSELNISNTSISYYDVKALLKHCTNLNTLDISNNHNIGSTEFKVITKMLQHYENLSDITL